MDRSPGGPCRPEPPLCPPRVGCGHGRVRWGAAPILSRCARCSGTLAWARPRGRDPPQEQVQPHPPPPAPPLAREPQERPSAPPEPRGRPPPPPTRDRDAGGGGDAAGPAPAGVAAAGRAHASVPEQRAQRDSMGAAPHLTLP